MPHTRKLPLNWRKALGHVSASLMLCCVGERSWAADDALQAELRAAILPCYRIAEGPHARLVARIEIDGTGALASSPRIATRGGVTPDPELAASVIAAIENCAPFSALAPKLDEDGAQLLLSFERSWRSSNATLPAGLCWLSPTTDDYDDRMWTRFTPPPQRGVNLYQLAFDCDTLERGRQTGDGRPRRMLVWHIENSEQEFPKSLEPFLDVFEDRFSADPAFLRRDQYAVYVAQVSKPQDRVKVTGSSASTFLNGRPTIMSLVAFNSGSADEAHSDLSSFIETLHRR